MILVSIFRRFDWTNWLQAWRVGYNCNG